jgi:hypothetical protein
MHVPLSTMECIALDTALGRANTQMDDDALMLALRHCVSRINEYREVVVVDSQQIALFMQRAMGRHARTLELQLHTTGSRLVLLPIHHANHWSLLVHCPRYLRWYYMDSCEMIHWDYVLAFLKRLQLDGVVTHFADVNQSLRPIVMQRQLWDWECGHYLLLYACNCLGTLAAHGHLLDREEGVNEYDPVIVDMMQAVTNQTRLEFIRDLRSSLNA